MTLSLVVHISTTQMQNDNVCLFGKMIYIAFSSLFVSVLYIGTSDPCIKAMLLLWMDRIYRSYTHKLYVQIYVLAYIK